MPKKGENIYKRKDGRWEGRYFSVCESTGELKRHSVYAHSYTEVKKKLLECKGQKRELSKLSFLKDFKYNEILSQWLNASRCVVKESTYSRYSLLVDSHIRPRLGEYSLDEMNTFVIDNYIQFLFNNGRLDGKGGLSSKTISDILVIIRSSLKFAKSHKITIACNLDSLSVKKSTRQTQSLTLEEQRKLVEVLLDDMNSYKFGILLALYTGIRLGELCALKWEDFSFINSTVKVRKTLQRIQNKNNTGSGKTKIIISTPKSICSIREIPLPSFLVYYAERFSCAPDCYILSGNPQKFVEPRTMQNRFKKCILKGGIRSVGFHSLRHTFATRCIEIGFDIKTLSEILGHANINITLSIYVHSSFERKRESMDKLILPNGI